MKWKGGKWVGIVSYKDKSVYQIAKITIKTSNKEYIDNYAANSLIKDLLKQNDKHKVSQNTKNKVVNKALNIYKQINEQKNHYVINSLLKLLYQFEKPDQIMSIWNDIMQLREKHNCDVSFPLLMKCCIKADNINVSECIEILEWIKHCKYKLRLHGFFINKLISKTNNNLQHLKCIDCMIYDYKIIEDNNDIITKTVLINAYSENKSPENILRIFNSIKDIDKDIVIIGAVMNGLIDNKWYQQSLEIYDKYETIHNEITHILGIKACIKYKLKEKCLNIIENKINMNNLSTQHKNILIDVYGQCGDIYGMNRIFDSFIKQQRKYDIYTINGMMKGYLNNFQNNKVIDLYDNIPIGLVKDSVTYLLAIKACNGLTNMNKVQEIYKELENRHDFDVSLEIKNALIEFYGNCLEIKNAENIFNLIEDIDKDIVTISSMMNVYCNNNLNNETVKLFNELKSDKFKHIEADIICYAIVLKACCNGDLFDFGMDIFVNLQRDSNLKWMLNDINLQIPLITLFGKNGMIEESETIFNDIKNNKYNEYRKEINIWNAMICAYSKNNNIMKAEKLYSNMKIETELNGDIFTFCGLLSGYSHNGEINKAYDIWNNEIKDNDIKYNKIVMATMVDVLSRSGKLSQAFELIEIYENYKNNQPYHVMWSALLNGAVMHQNELVINIYDEYENRFGNDDKLMDSASKLLKKI
eukprot:538804_1